jgi:hypothetical protein
MFKKLGKKRLAAVAFIGALAITGVSVAYFTGGSGTGTGSGTVGAPSAWTVATTGTPTWSGSLTALYPGATNDTEYIPFTVKNNGNGNQAVSNITLAVPAEANGDAETAAGGDIPGCPASSFMATLDAGNPSLPSDVAPGSTYNGKIDLIMKDLPTTDQTPCKNTAPAVTITAS